MKVNNKVMKLGREENEGAKDAKYFAKETKGIIEDVRSWSVHFCNHEGPNTAITVKGKEYEFQAVIPAKIGDGIVLHWFHDRMEITGIQLMNDKGEVYYRYHESDGASWLNTYFAQK